VAFSTSYEIANFIVLYLSEDVFEYISDDSYSVAFIYVLCLRLFDNRLVLFQPLNEPILRFYRNIHLTPP